MPLDFETKNIRKLQILQRFCKKNQKYWRFERWVRSRSFAEWFYAPENPGGRLSKLQIQRAVEQITL